MKLKHYEKIVDKHSKKEEKGKNIIISFLVGGALGLFGQIFVGLLEGLFYMPLSECYMYLMIFLVVVSSVLTGIGVMDKAVSEVKCGLLVPTTGFAHSMTSAAMDYKKEGLVTGIGANIFKMTGTIILYSLVAGVFLALLKGAIL